MTFVFYFKQSLLIFCHYCHDISRFCSITITFRSLMLHYILLTPFWGLKPWWIAVNTVKLVRVVYIELLLIIVLYFLLKPIFVEFVSSISVYLCRDGEFLLNYNFQSCSILLFLKFTSFGWTRGYGEMEHQPQKAW